MKLTTSILINVFFLVQVFSVPALSQGFDFFYLVQRWPGSCCNTAGGCCYSGKPASDFLIHGLWPTYNSGSSPWDCDPNNPFRSSELSDLIIRMDKYWPAIDCPYNVYKFWMNEWEKHGTCSDSVLNQHDYFEAALDLKKRTDLLNNLAKSDITPNGSSYSLEDITFAIRARNGYKPWIECNTDSSGKNQLYQVYMCVDKSGRSLTDCPVVPSICDGECPFQIHFPSF